MERLFISILLTALINYWWSGLEHYNIAFAIPFSVVFFIPILHKMTYWFVPDVNKFK
jgi:predicted small integral membrane protein